jgi:cytochrome P450
MWVLTRHADCLAVLRDRRASSDSSNLDPERLPEGFADDRARRGLIGDAEYDNRPFLFRDPPDHTRMRGLVSKAFTPRMVEGLRPRTEAIVNELLDAALARGEMDAVADFAYPLPVRIICDMLGVPVADQDRFQVWSAALARGLDPDFLLTEEVHQARMEAVLAFAEYFFALLAERRADPGPDLLSQLALAEEAGDQLTEGEMLTTAILLLVAGHETTVNLIAGGVLALLEHPDQLDRLRSDPSLARSAVEEMLRYVSPVQLTGRSITDDLPVGGEVLAKGDFALLLIASANHDPEAFSDPEDLDLGRVDNRHLAFGFGLHHCLGAPLARLEAQVAFTELLRRTTDVELATDQVTYRENVVLRGLAELPVRLVRA